MEINLKEILKSQSDAIENAISESEEIEISQYLMTTHNELIRASEN